MIMMGMAGHPSGQCDTCTLGQAGLPAASSKLELAQPGQQRCCSMLLWLPCYAAVDLASLPASTFNSICLVLQLFGDMRTMHTVEVAFAAVSPRRGGGPIGAC
jgi:hypothetical protein